MAIGRILVEGAGSLPLLEYDLGIGIAKAQDEDGVIRFINLRNTLHRIELNDDTKPSGD